MSISPPPPPGWFPDPAGGTAMRWWDGARWTDAVQAAPAGAVVGAAPLRAPEGTSIASPWIWLIVGLPLLPLAGLFFIDWGGYLADVLAQPQSIAVQLSIYLQPGYLVAAVGGWLLSLLSILWAFLDWRRLRANGVPQPFHFAFILFTLLGAGYWVYLIGRTVVLRRRTGQSAMGPIWVAIGTAAVALIAGVVVTVQIFAATAALVR